MRYISTRDNTIQYSASQAIAQGLARDGGLLTPFYIPKLPGKALEDMRDMAYQQRAVYVMKQYLEEECREALEAIDNQDTDNLCEELGDVLYQIMIHCEIEKEQGHFTVDDVIDGISRKMIRRHPRVFGGPDHQGDLGSQLSWEEIKRRASNSSDRSAHSLR